MASTTAVAPPDLPDDVLHLVTLELWRDRDFATLFSCAMASRRLVLPAVSALYRMHEIAPVTYRGRSDEPAREEVTRLTAKWANLWRSMILSSIGQTLHPYCHYSRALNLDDLTYLFEDVQFNGKILKGFFAGMQAILDDGGAGSGGTSAAVPKAGPGGKVNKRGWKYSATAQALGNAVVQKSPMIEELSGNLEAGALQSWIPLLKRLRRIQLWSGRALDGLGAVIAAECPYFNACEFYNWAAASETSDSGGGAAAADEPLSAFFNDLRPQSLESFRIVGSSQIGPLALSALGASHGTVLTELLLTDLPPQAVTELNMLRECIALRTLLISAQTRTVDIKATHPGVFEDVVDWLRACRDLTRVKFTNFLSGASILTAVLLGGNLKLMELELSHYTQESGPAFYDSLSGQAEYLTELVLQSDAEDDALRIDGVVESVCRLRRLRVLHLKTISDFFRNEHIVLIASSLRQLAELRISGWWVGDAIFDALAGLHAMRNLDLSAFSNFSFDGIAAYIAALRLPGNSELLLSISMANPHKALSDEEQQAVKQLIADKVDGRFDYTTSRDPDAGESSESDSD